MKHKHADVIIEWANGAEVEYYDDFNKVWCAATTPCWSVNSLYRVKPRDLRTDSIDGLKFLQGSDDPESAHSQADDILCELLISLGYKDVVEEYTKVDRWYA